MATRFSSLRMKGMNSLGPAKEYSHFSWPTKRGHTHSQSKAYNRLRTVHYLNVLFFGLTFLLCTVTAYVFSKANYNISSVRCVLGARWVLQTPTNTAPYKKREAGEKARAEKVEISENPGRKSEFFSNQRPTMKTTENISYNNNNNNNKNSQREKQGIFARLNGAKSRPGNENDCNFVQFGNVAAAIGGFILCWFFLLVKPYYDAYAEKMSTSSAKLVPWVLLISLTFTLVSCIASIKLSAGFAQWCANLVMGNPENRIVRCSDMSSHRLYPQNLLTRGDRGVDIYTMMVAAQTCSWLAFACWLLALSLILLRFVLHLDYPSYFFELHETIQQPVPSDSRKKSSVVVALPVVST